MRRKNNWESYACKSACLARNEPEIWKGWALFHASATRYTPRAPGNFTRILIIVENCGNTLILRCSLSERGGTAEFASRLIGKREIIRPTGVTQPADALRWRGASNPIDE